jgi:hypothetical protein
MMTPLMDFDLDATKDTTIAEKAPQCEELFEIESLLLS